jgi:anti-anti-sigma regulatory factor
MPKDSGTNRAGWVPMTDSISIEGRITIENSDELPRKFRTILPVKPTRLTVDLSGATFLDTWAGEPSSSGQVSA